MADRMREMMVHCSLYIIASRTDIPVHNFRAAPQYEVGYIFFGAVSLDIPYCH